MYTFLKWTKSDEEVLAGRETLLETVTSINQYGFCSQNAMESIPKRIETV